MYCVSINLPMKIKVNTLCNDKNLSTGYAYIANACHEHSHLFQKSYSKIRQYRYRSDESISIKNLQIKNNENITLVDWDT